MSMYTHVGYKVTKSESSKPYTIVLTDLLLIIVSVNVTTF